MHAVRPFLALSLAVPLFFVEPTNAREQLPVPSQAPSSIRTALNLANPHGPSGLEVRSLLPPEDELGENHRIVRTAPYPDVDEDGTADVLEIDLDLREAHPIYGFVGTLGLSTLSGRDGKVIARYSMPFDSGVPHVVMARLGERAKPGVVITLNRFISTPEHPTSEFIATAVSAQGKELWSQQIVGTSTSTPTRLIGATDVVHATDLLEAPKDSSDLLVNIYDYAGAILTLTPAVIDGSTGELREQTPVAVPWIEGTPMAIGIPDVDQDLDLGRRDDILIVDTSGRQTGVMARSSSTGAELWHNAEVIAGAGSVSAHLGNAAGDPTEDFVIGAPLRLFDGATGEVKWQRPGGPVVLTTGRVDEDRRLDITSIGVANRGKRFGANIETVSALGKVLGQSRYMAKASESGFSWLLYELTGDVNRDEILDVFVLLAGENQRHISVDGGSSRRVLEAEGLYPLHGSLQGTSENLVTIVSGEGRFLVSPRLANGRPLWETKVTAPQSYYFGWVVAVGDAVVLTLQDREGARTFLLEGQSGRVIWTRTLGD